MSITSFVSVYYVLAMLSLWFRILLLGHHHTKSGGSLSVAMVFRYGCYGFIFFYMILDSVAMVSDIVAMVSDIIAMVSDIVAMFSDIVARTPPHWGWRIFYSSRSVYF